MDDERILDQLLPQVWRDWRQRPRWRRSILPVRVLIPAPITRQFDQERALDDELGPREPLRWCYGIPLVTDPRDFFPDPWHCTPIQLRDWHDAVRHWDLGLLVEFPSPGRELWGIGISILRPHDHEYDDPSAAWKRGRDVAPDP